MICMFKPMVLLKKYFLLLIKLAVAAGVLVLLVKVVHIGEIRSAFANPKNPACIAAASFLLLPNLFLQWYRWHFLLGLIEPRTPVSESVGSLFGGMVGGIATPGRIGEFSRPLFLSRADQTRALGLVILDKFYALFPILIGGIWGIVLFLSYLFGYNLYLVWPLSAVALLISVLVLLLAFHPEWTRNFLYHLTVLFPSKDKLRKVIGVMDFFKKKQARILFMLSCLLYAVYIVQFCLLAFAFQKLPWTTALTATTSTIFAKTLLPFSFADLGIREGAAIFFFLKFNVQKVTAFNSSLLLFAINVVLPTLAGFFFIPKLNIFKIQNK
jgi:uncharacterized membrane protein YbhN (UPF0104 family)